MSDVLSTTEAKATPICEALEKGLVSRKDLAAMLGCSGSAITNAIQRDRRVHVVLREDGTAEAFEVSPFPGRK